MYLPTGQTENNIHLIQLYKTSTFVFHVGD